MRPIMIKMLNICKCGCGRIAKEGNRFINGHNLTSAMLGKHHTTKTRRKISKTLMGRKHTKETKRKISEALSGENHPNWRDGISCNPYSLEYLQIRESIRERDNHTCQLCGKTKESDGRKLSVHHIDYNKDNCDPRNLITLCNSCNAEVNGDREVWMCIFRGRIKNVYTKLLESHK